MRLNKKRLAALAMSAVMAASAVPFPVYAEELSAGEDVVVSAETTVETPEVGAADNTVHAENIEFYYNSDSDFGVTYLMRGDNVKQEMKLTQDDGVTITSKTEANCQHGTQVILQATILGQVKTGVVDDGKLGEHTWRKVTGEITIPPTCTSKGEGVTYEICDVCGKKQNEKKDQLAELPHVYDEQVRVKSSKNIKVDEDNQLVLDEDGNVQLINEKEAGWYILEKHCSNTSHTLNGGWVEQSKVDVPATTATGARIKAKSVKGIKTDLSKYYSKQEVSTFPLEEDSIELEDCDESGFYTVEYLDENGKAVAEKDVEVKPHHYQVSKTAVFKSEADRKQAIISWDEKTKTLTVKSSHCTNPIEYVEVTHCNSDSCKLGVHKPGKNEFEYDKDGNKVTNCSGHVIESVKKTAEAVGKHSIAESIKKDITEYATAHKYDAKLSEIEARIKGEAKDYVELDVPEDVCERGGEVTVKYICKIDKKTVVETQKITVVGEGHKTPAVGKIENEVKATCQNPGSYDLVKRCERCGKELSKESKKTPRLKHTNEESVAVDKKEKDTSATLEFVGDKLVDDKGAYLNKKNWNIGKGNWAGYEKYGKTFRVVPTIYNNCTECNDHKVLISEVDYETFKIVEVQKEDSKGQNGYIVFEATYKKPLKDGSYKIETVKSGKIPYYSTMEAYTGRVEDAVLNGLHKDDDGVYRYYVNGELQKDYTGMIEDNKEKYLVVKGVLATDINGLWHSDVDKVWYFFVEGHVRADYTGVALYDGEWFYVSNGKLDEGVTGLVPYNGGTFLFTDGRLRNDVNGLWQDINNPADWYFLALGQVQNQYSGVAQYDGAFFVVKNGKLDTSYNGTIKYDGKTFKVVNGQLITK